MKDPSDHQPAPVPAPNPPQIPIPPQPSPGVQETTFAADDASELAVLEHEPIPEDPSSSPIPPQNAAKSPTRSIPPDLLRGLLMVLMALDHNVLALRSWPHGTALPSDHRSNDSDTTVPVDRWNNTPGYVIRTLTHLCAPGFVFLMGMGVVYFGRSRAGWGTGRMVWHFGVRAGVLLGLSEVMGGLVSMGRVWVFNVVLWALAVDYLVVGVGWVVLARVEGMVAFLLLKELPEGWLLGGGKRKKGKGVAEREPLLGDRGDSELAEEMAPDRSIIRAADISWHLHNVVLVVLAVVTIWWNIWLSPTGGYCHVEERSEVRDMKVPESIWFRFWFYPVMTPHVLSGFPPMAWLSFAILGLLYGRIILARSWSTTAITAGNTLAGVVFSLIFVATRLFHLGNLSEDCLQMPEHIANPDRNQYLASTQSFFYLIKYPPDVAFWSFTMAVNFFLLALFSIIPAHFSTRAFKVLLVFGTSALFFYFVHNFLLFALATVFISFLGHEMPFEDMLTGKLAIGVDQLWAFFLNWGLVLAIMYPVCRWYGGFKRSKGPESIWRFF